MILLTATQTLELLLAAAPATTQPTYVTDWVDEDTTTFALGAVGSADGVTTSTSAVTAVASPSSGSVRRVTGLSLYNTDTVSVIATVQLNDNGTVRTIWKGLVQDGDTLLYDDQRGFYLITSSGELRVAITNIGTASSSSSAIAAHATTHEAGGTDAIPLDTLAAPSDVTTLNVSSAKHGLTPKSPADATTFLNGAATPAYAQVKDSDLSTSDITTNNASSTKHGLMPKLDNTASHYFKGDGSQGAIAAGDVPTLNQNTTGSAAKLTTARTIAGVSFDGSANITLASGNLSDTANLPLINANNHFTGTGDQTFDGNVKPATTQMFSWTAKLKNTVYQAASDGFVTGYFQTVGGSEVLSVLTDAANPPTTTRQVVGLSAVVGPYFSFCCPVRKGDYYKLLDGGSPAITLTAWWVPLGTAG